MPTATSSSSSAAAVGPTGCPFSPTRQCSGFPGGPTFDPLNLATTAPGGGSSASISLPGDQSARGRPSEREKSRGDLSARRRHRLSPFSQEAAYARAGLLSPRSREDPTPLVRGSSRDFSPPPPGHPPYVPPTEPAPPPRPPLPRRLTDSHRLPAAAPVARSVVVRPLQLPPAGAPTRRRRLRRRRRPRRRPGVVFGRRRYRSPDQHSARHYTHGGAAIGGVESSPLVSALARTGDGAEHARRRRRGAGGGGGGGGGGVGGGGGGGGGGRRRPRRRRRRARSGGGGGGAVPRALAAPHAVVGPRHRRHHSDAARRHRFSVAAARSPASAPSPRASAAQSNSPTSARFAALERRSIRSSR